MILFLFGEDTFRSNEKLTAIKQRFIGVHGADNLFSLDFPSAANEDIYSLIFAPSLFAGHRLLILTNLLAEGNKDVQTKVSELLKQDLPESVTIIFWENKKFDKRQALYKFLNKPKTSQEFASLSPLELKKHIRELAVKSELQLTEANIDWLILNKGNDLWSIFQELQKLASYPGEITTKTLQDLVTPTPQEVGFALQDGIMNKNATAANRALNELLAQDVDFNMIIGSLAYYLRNLIRVLDLKDQNRSMPEIIKATGLHPFVIKKNLSYRGDKKDLIKQLELLAVADQNMKTGAQPSGVLQLLVHELV